MNLWILLARVAVLSVQCSPHCCNTKVFCPFKSCSADSSRSLIWWRILISNSLKFLTPCTLGVTWLSSTPSRTAHSLERAKEDGGGLWFLAAGSALGGDAVCNQRGVLPAAHLPLCHHHFQVCTRLDCQPQSDEPPRSMRPSSESCFLCQTPNFPPARAKSSNLTRNIFLAKGDQLRP